MLDVLFVALTIALFALVGLVARGVDALAAQSRRTPVRPPSAPAAEGEVRA